MSIEYKINVLKELKLKGYNTSRLRKEKILGEATIQRLRHNKSVSFDILSKICNLLECDLDDILECKSNVKKNYDKIKLIIEPKGKKEDIESYANEKGESLNGFINRVIDEAMEDDNEN